MDEREQRREHKRRLVRRRQELAERMGKLDHDQLVAIMETGTEEEKRASAIAVGELGRPRALPVLLKALETTDSDDVRNGVACGLESLADPRALDPLLRQVRRLRAEDGDYDTLVFALEPLDARSAVVDLAHILCDGYYAAALMAVSVLEGFAGPPEEDVRQEALRVLRECDGQWNDDVEIREDMIAYAIELLEGAPPDED